MLHHNCQLCCFPRDSNWGWGHIPGHCTRDLCPQCPGGFCATQALLQRRWGVDGPCRSLHLCGWFWTSTEGNPMSRWELYANAVCQSRIIQCLQWRINLEVEENYFNMVCRVQVQSQLPDWSIVNQGIYATSTKQCYICSLLYRLTFLEDDDEVAGISPGDQ